MEAPYLLIEEVAEAAALYLRVHDPVLAPVINHWGPCPLTKTEDPFRELCRAIVFQQLSIKAADTIWKRLLALQANIITPDTLAALTFEEMRSVGLSGQKATYLHAIAAWFAQHPELARSLPSLPSEEVMKHLTQIKGVGVWTVHMFLMFSLNRANVLPVGDLGLRKGVQLLYGLLETPGPADLVHVAEAWGPYPSIATWYVWRFLHNPSIIHRER